LTFVAGTSPVVTNIQASWSTTTGNPIRNAPLVSAVGGSASNIWSGGLLLYDQTVLPNPGSNGTLFPLYTYNFPAHTMTNNGDSLRFVFSGISPSQANTNQWAIVVTNVGGAQATVAWDSGMTLSSNGFYKIEFEMTRIGNTNHHFQTDFHAANITSPTGTNFFSAIPLTNGLQLGVILQATARRAGSFSNLMNKVYFQPGPR
jgi:hypothetical protein